MSWVLFIDESGQDRRDSPYEVLAGLAVNDRAVWPLIRNLSDLQARLFGMRLFESYGSEAKAQKLLKRKVFQHAAQMDAIPFAERTRLACEILQDGTLVTRPRLTALAQAKLAYCAEAFRLCLRHGAVAFASIVPQDALRPLPGGLRKDYAYLFERYYHFLNGKADDPMGFLVFDEMDKSASQVLLGQVAEYFVRTSNGRTRSRLIVPEPLFVHSDLTTMVQMADLLAYTISWGVRLRGMTSPARAELTELASLALRLRYASATDVPHPTYGYKVIRDLRPKSGQ